MNQLVEQRHSALRLMDQKHNKLVCINLSRLVNGYLEFQREFFGDLGIIKIIIFTVFV